MSVRKFAKDLRISRSLVYKYIKALKLETPLSEEDYQQLRQRIKEGRQWKEIRHERAKQRKKERHRPMPRKAGPTLVDETAKVGIHGLNYSEEERRLMEDML